ncbi:MAG: type II toxin-antitoxin system VapC family toxin [Myxococcota bacterium]
MLDTNAVSALMRGNAAVLARLQRAGKSEVGVPQPVLAEIAYGIERLPRSRRKDWLRRRFDSIREELPRSPWTDDVSERFGEIKAKLARTGRPIEDFDAAVAAHALASGAVLVTADAAHMSRVVGLETADWARLDP